MLNWLFSTILDRIDRSERTILMSQANLARQLREAREAIDRGRQEQIDASDALKADVQRLTEALENQDNVSPELQEAADAVTASAKQLDDLVQNAPTLPEQPEEPAQG